jgi:hypothetical protein
MSGGYVTTNRKLGRRPPKNAPALRLADFLTGQVPAHPAAADHFANISEWGLWSNDTIGDCGPVSFYNLRKLVTAYAAGVEAQPTQDDVFALYKLVNPDFDPETGTGDNGVDMQTMLELALKHEVCGPGVMLGFAKVDVSNLDEVRAATSIFGGVLHGVDLETAQQAQTDAGGPWDYKRSGEWGGHAILSGRYTDPAGTTQDRTGVVSWGEVVDCTDAFETHQLEECWVVLFQEHLDHPAFQEGVDVTALASAYESLTGRPFPVRPSPDPQPEPPAPAPEPVPGPVDDADQALARAIHPWVTMRQESGLNKHAQNAMKTWLAAKNL